MMHTPDIDHLVGHWVDAWNTRQIDQILSMYSDDAELISAQFLPLRGKTNVKGKDEIRSAIEQILSRSTHMAFSVTETLPTGVPGNYLVVVAVSGGLFKTRLIQRWELASGLIARSETYLGTQEGGILPQAGNSAPPPGGASPPQMSQEVPSQFQIPQPIQRHLPPPGPTAIEYDQRWPLFDDNSPFVERDNRQFRPLLPTTADLLNRRHESMLPAHVVTGKSMLDIGCALAATGKWVLDRGAQAYVGVEPQKDYADIGQELLEVYPGASIVCERGLEFFAGCTEPYDIVGLLGVLHGQYDPLLFIEAACRLAKEYVCIENLGSDADGQAMIPQQKTWMPAAHIPAGSQGFGWTISPSALTTIMAHFGFAPDMVPFYTDPGPGPSTRYALRYKRVGTRGATAGDFANLIEWKYVKLGPILAQSPTAKLDTPHE
jgi:hypothetical protein